MNNAMIDGITNIDEDLIEKYFLFKTMLAAKRTTAKSHRIWQTIGAVAACFTIILSVSLWLFVPIENDSQIEKTYRINTDNLYMQYREVSVMSRFEMYTLESKIGDIYYEEEGVTYYKLQNRDSVDFLIMLGADGEYKLLEFRRCYSGEEDKEITLKYIFNSIYGIDNAEQIKKITFKKVDSAKNGTVDRDVIVDEVTVNENDINQRILSILYSLIYSDDYKAPCVLPYDEEYLNGEMALSSQTERKITLYLNDNRNIEMEFIPYGNCVYMNGAFYAGVSNSDCQWLIDVANIDMEYHNWGIPNDVDGAIASP